MDIVFLNGEYVPKGQAVIPVEDRGFLFGDGVYEVTPFYGGRPLRLDHHIRRLARGLRELRIGFDPSPLAGVHHELLERNRLADAEMALVYVQVTRGAAPRTHHFPDPAPSPTVFASARSFRRPTEEEWERGFSAVTVPDQRWARADLKTIQLLPNVLAQQAARDAGVTDALLVRNGLALEGSHNNVFAVMGDAVVTHPASNQILNGITREAVIEIARERGHRVEERVLPIGELRGASEVFFTGTTTEVRPTVTLDGRPVGDGAVGPVARDLQEGFLELVARECGIRIAAGAGG